MPVDEVSGDHVIPVVLTALMPNVVNAVRAVRDAAGVVDGLEAEGAVSILCHVADDLRERKVFDSICRKKVQARKIRTWKIGSMGWILFGWHARGSAAVKAVSATAKNCFITPGVEEKVVPVVRCVCVVRREAKPIQKALKSSRTPT